MAAKFDALLNKLRIADSGGGGGSATWGLITGTLSSQTDLQTALNAKENTVASGTSSQYYRGDKTFQTLDKSAVGLSNVTNNAQYYAGGTDVAIADGGTGQSTQTAGFNALSPLTTKGDFVVFDGTNNVRMPIGTDTYLLTADSAQTNGLKWAALSAAITEFEATVGSGGDYSTLGAAVTAGKKRLKLISNTTESADITFLDKMYIGSGDRGFAINMQGNRIITTNAHTYYFNNWTLAHDNVTTGTECVTNSTYRLLAINCIFDNNASSDGETTFGTTNSNTVFAYCQFQGARQDFFKGIPDASSGAPSTSIIDCTFIGEGSNARVSIGTQNNSYAEITGIYVRGTYAATALRLSGQAVNVFANGLAVSISIDSNSTVNTIRCAALTVSTNNVVVNNAEITSLTLNTSASKCSFTNIYNTGNTTISSGSTNTSFTTTYFGGSTLTDSGTNTKISTDDCQFAGFTNGIVAKVTAASDTADWKLTRHFDCTSNAITCNLPAAANCKDRVYMLIKTDSSVNAVTIDPNASETINGATTTTLVTQYAAIVIQSDGANWFTF